VAYRGVAQFAGETAGTGQCLNESSLAEWPFWVEATLNPLFPSLTMVTINQFSGNNHEANERLECTGFDVLSNVDQQPWTQPDRHWWQKWKNKVTALAAACFGMTDEYEMQEREGIVRNRIRREMQYATPGQPNENALRATVRQVFRETGYDLGAERLSHVRAHDLWTAEREEEEQAARAPLEDMDEEDEQYDPDGDYADLASEVSTRDGNDERQDVDMVAVLVPAERLDDAWNEFAEGEGLVPGFAELPVHTRLAVIPSFVAAMVATLRSKFGRQPLTEANRLLIEREYLRIAREGNVREKDIAHHSAWVYNTYFSEDVYDQVPGVRQRVPGWMRAAGRPTLTQPPAVC